MRIKFTMFLVIALILFGFTDTSGNGRILETVFINQFEGVSANEDAKILTENGSVMSCRIQTKKSTVRDAGNGNLAVSVSTNWICR